MAVNLDAAWSPNGTGGPVPFHRVIRQFTTGVTVVTTVGPDGVALGCTVSAFCAVSESPPLVLICIGRQRAICAALVEAPGYAVSILRSDQGAIARAFADPAADRFSGVPTRIGRHGIPLLADAIARVQCDRESVLGGGDHMILIGRVVSAELGGGEPLIYSRGLFIDPTAADLSAGLSA